MAEFEDDVAIDDAGGTESSLDERAPREALGRLDEGKLGELLYRDHISLRPGAGCGDEHELIAADLLDFHPGDLHVRFGEDDAEVEGAGAGVLDRVLGVRDAEAEIDVGVLCAERREHVGEPVAADRHARAEYDAALRAVREAVEMALELSRAREDVLGPFVDGVSCLGEVDVSALAVEERGAESLLERADVPGDDRLRDEQVIRGAPDAAELDDQREHLELAQRDAEVQGHRPGEA